LKEAYSHCRELIRLVRAAIWSLKALLLSLRASSWNYLAFLRSTPPTKRKAAASLANLEASPAFFLRPASLALKALRRAAAFLALAAAAAAAAALALALAALASAAALPQTQQFFSGNSHFAPSVHSDPALALPASHQRLPYGSQP